MSDGKLVLSEELKSFLLSLPDLDFELLLSSYQSSLPESFRINTLKVSHEKALELLSEEGFSFIKIPWLRDGYYVKPEGLLSHTIWYKLGLVYIQGAVSMLASELLDVSPGHKVLDLCAAPGSKATHIGQLLGGRGVIVANDVSTSRVKALASNLQRCGVLNSVITQWDGRIFGRRLRGYFDRVLLDAPCSALGIISKDWGVGRRWRERVSLTHSKLQKGLIISAYDCLKPGGYMIYATCTLHPLENEEVVMHLLNSRQDARLCRISVEGLNYSNGLTEWGNRRYHGDMAYCIRVYPYHSGSEGFFFAKIRKEVGGGEEA